jgi:hypothetical protein
MNRSSAPREALVAGDQRTWLVKKMQAHAQLIIATGAFANLLSVYMPPKPPPTITAYGRVYCDVVDCKAADNS